PLSYPLSLHDALPIYGWRVGHGSPRMEQDHSGTDAPREQQINALSRGDPRRGRRFSAVSDLPKTPSSRFQRPMQHALHWALKTTDRKSTRLNSSHQII